MLKSTYFNGHKATDMIYDIQDDVAKRWSSKGIAEIIEVESPIEVEKEVTAKDLFHQCKALKITLDKEMINGKTEAEKIEYLLSMLNTQPSEDEQGNTASEVSE